MATLRIFGKANAPRPITLAGPRLLAFEDLPLKGIRFSRHYLRRLWESDRFPKPIKISERRLAWSEASIDKWIEDKTRESA
jgi:predicted DNA-binding transcriptional regulator AlpA